MITFEVRQQVSSVTKNWLVPVYTSPVKRLAKTAFECFREEHPDSYFELVEVTKDEVCLEFTPKESQ